MTYPMNDHPSSSVFVDAVADRQETLELPLDHRER